jgi:hypothetical protein
MPRATGSSLSSSSQGLFILDQSLPVTPAAAGARFCMQQRVIWRPPHSATCLAIRRRVGVAVAGEEVQEHVPDQIARRQIRSWPRDVELDFGDLARGRKDQVMLFITFVKTARLTCRRC